MDLGMILVLFLISAAAALLVGLEIHSRRRSRQGLAPPQGPATQTARQPDAAGQTVKKT